MDVRSVWPILLCLEASIDDGSQVVYLVVHDARSEYHNEFGGRCLGSIACVRIIF